MAHFNDKKMAVLRVVQKQLEPIGIHELIAYLPEKFAERSVRRWLSELASSGFIEKTGQKKSTQYGALLEFLTRLREEPETCFSQTSLKILDKTRRPLFERTPVSYNDQWLQLYKPNKSFYLPALLRAQLLELGTRAHPADPAGSYAHRIFNRLLIDLSYNSSRLEGNTYSLLETEKLLLEGTGVEGKSEDDKIMILNHKEAIRYLVNSALKLQISSETIYTLHYLLSDALIEDRLAGHVRNHAVRISGSVYLPYADSHKLQKILDLIIKKASLIKDPYEQSFFLLIHLSYLQPFADVNKRTSRLAANIPLIKNNLVPLSFNDISREDYASAVIAIYELQQMQPLMDLYLFSYKRTCALYDATVQSIEVDVVRARYRPQRRQLLAAIILKKKVGPSIAPYIKTQAEKLIPMKDRASFIQDVHEDLKYVNAARLYGLGITPKELHAWEKSQKR